jgi:biotin transport system substrate-specific component
MNQTIPQAIDTRIERAQLVSNVLLVIAGSAIIALAAQIAIPVPFSPVPLTMQPLAVLLVGAVLGAQRGMAAAMLYLLEGLSGMPVFAQGHAGPLWLIGPTAGFLYSYPFAAFLAGWLSQRGWAVGGMFAGLGVIYLGGWSWLAMLTDPKAAFALGVAPFVLADLIKIAFGAALLPLAQRAIARA